VDLAIEIPQPDGACRERLIRLYARDMAADADTAGLVAQTEGVTASFIKELVRRAALASLRGGDRPPALRQAHVDAVLAEMNVEQQALTRSLLGGDTSRAEARPVQFSPGAFRRPRR
jgi:ATP-dependent 26S proteasome regulatory subunit